MKKRLNALLEHSILSKNGRQEHVLELMAGCGRNAALLNKYFKKVSMVEAASKNLPWWPKYVEAFNCKVQDFDFKEDNYDCIVGVWCLSYLNSTDREELLDKIFRSLRHKGYLILFEAVLR